MKTFLRFTSMSAFATVMAYYADKNFGISSKINNFFNKSK